MKAAGLVIVLPLLSVVVLSLFAMGGTGRWTALAVLACTVVGLAISWVRKRNPGTENK